jgi:hypothetical protein
MQQGRFRATGMMNNHPQALRKYSVAILTTEKVAHFWKAYPGHFSKAPKVEYEQILARVKKTRESVIRMTDRHYPNSDHAPIRGFRRL